MNLRAEAGRGPHEVIVLGSNMVIEAYLGEFELGEGSELESMPSGRYKIETGDVKTVEPAEEGGQARHFLPARLEYSRRRRANLLHNEYEADIPTNPHGDIMVKNGHPLPLENVRLVDRELDKKTVITIGIAVATASGLVIQRLYKK